MKDFVGNKGWNLLCYFECQILPLFINISFKFSKLSTDVCTYLLMNKFFNSWYVSLGTLPTVKVSSSPFITVRKIKINPLDVPFFGYLNCHKQVSLFQTWQEISMIIKEHTIFWKELRVHWRKHMFVL